MPIEFRNVKEILGKRIRKIRESKDYSQENIAGELNMTTSAYSKIERGITDVPTSKLIKIADILEVEVSDLFSETRSKKNSEQEISQQFGFATKSDIVEIVKMFQDLEKTVNQLKLELSGLNLETNKISKNKT